MYKLTILVVILIATLCLAQRKTYKLTDFSRAILDQCVIANNKFDSKCVKKVGEDMDMSKATIFFATHAPFKKVAILLRSADRACQADTEEECAVNLAKVATDIGTTAAGASIPFAGPYMSKVANEHFQRWIDKFVATRAGQASVGIVGTLVRAIRSMLESTHYGQSAIDVLSKVYNVVSKIWGGRIVDEL